MRSSSASAASRPRSGRLGDVRDAPFARRVHEDAQRRRAEPRDRRGAASDDHRVPMRRRTRAPRPAPREASSSSNGLAPWLRRVRASLARGRQAALAQATAVRLRLASTASRRDAQPLGDDDGKLLGRRTRSRGRRRPAARSRGRPIRTRSRASLPPEKEYAAPNAGLLPIVETRDLRKVFRTRKRTPGALGALRSFFSRGYEERVAVDGVTFALEPGELVGYIGPNGAGKSTTIKMLTGILVPTSGEVRVAGLVPWKQRQARTPATSASSSASAASSIGIFR